MQAISHQSSKRVEYGDRISSLPDEVLGHILSFLPTKHAVGTSILSLKWYLFTLITNLDFDKSLVFDPRSSQKYQELLDIRMLHCQSKLGSETLKLSSSFKDFVDRVLMLHKSPHISKFRLKCGLLFDCSNLNTWIRAALLRGVTDLDMSTTVQYDSNVLPLSLFASDTLVVLKLRGEFEMKVPLSLSHLKSLHLFTVKFSDDDCSLNRFIAGCPVLEDLVVGGHWEDVKVINISSSRLKSLTMDFSDGFMSCNHRSSVVLDLPNLVHFNYIDYLANDYVLSNLNSLEGAQIDVLLDIENMFFESEIFCSSVLSLINGLSNAKHLYLSGKCMEMEQMCLLETFFLREFLQSSPMLEHLVFAEGLLHRESDGDYDDKNIWSKQRKAPSCLLSHLKTITFDSFHGFDEELKIAKYFLRHGKVLKQMIIDWQIDTMQEYQELKKLLKIARASQECSIELMMRSPPQSIPVLLRMLTLNKNGGFEINFSQ